MLKPDITASFDPTTSTYSHVVRDPSSRACVIVSPVLGYDPAAGRTSHASAERLIARVRQHGLQVEWLLGTHVYADHLSAAVSPRRELGRRPAIGARVIWVQVKFSGLFNLGKAFLADGRQFGHPLEDGGSFRIGALEYRALHISGHIPAYMTYLIDDGAFVGDTLFMPDYGTARYGFSGGDACQLYRSAQRPFALLDVTRLFMCHNYAAPGRDEHRCETSVDEQCRHNVYVREGVDEGTFAAIRQQRDATLGIPTLMLLAIRVNMRDDNLPPVGGNGVHYLKIPLDLF